MRSEREKEKGQRAKKEEGKGRRQKDKCGRESAREEGTID